MDRFDYLIRALTRIDGLTGEAYEKRRLGLDWPKDAETMIGQVRLENVKNLALDVIERGIPGDFMECGIWRGGVGVLMAAVIAQSAGGRRLWLADSFQGCPVPDPQYVADQGDRHHTFEFLRVSPDEVLANFERYGLLGKVDLRILPGWFKDTLPGDVGQLALLRVDGDMYESTMQVLDALYSHVAPSGYVILDDYHNIPNCRAAIEDFRRKRGITAAIQSVDWCAVYWQKEPEEGRAAA
jgi:hypothetical protein